ncbi:hypothetical protein HHK36_006124 [Tetracentron sinense]|uniref:Fe2OG dioxygenase domain-containing protein n=1 Tax=Tetracentron sinense TaxID=13715 RepID=A0A834ZKR9_TETSI|nr:hypothetical protein HHK36_006124 [Tetracentron sinense]
MLELELIIRKMILESLGVEKYYNSHVENSNTILRVMKYEPPPSSASAIGLLAHTDTNIITILCQDEVQGLEVLSKEGNWLQVAPSKGTFVAVVGQVLKAWSNGRLHAAKHRVVMRGDTERYSCGLFSIPKDGVVIETPSELIDEEHPLLFRPFNYLDFLTYFHSNISDNALEIYAGV